MRERFPQWWSPGFFRSRCRGLPAGIPPGKDQNRFRPPVREEYRPPGCLVQDKKESPRRADGRRIERGNDGEESFSGNDPSRPEGSGRIKGGAMKAQGNYSIFKASLQSGGGVIRLVFLPVQGPGLFAVSAVGSLWFIVVHRGSNYPAEVRPDAGIYPPPVLKRKPLQRRLII